MRYGLEQRNLYDLINNTKKNVESKVNHNQMYKLLKFPVGNCCLHSHTFLTYNIIKLKFNLKKYTLVFNL